MCILNFEELEAYYMNENELLLLKLGEVVLKGQNRRSFEDV